MAKIGATTAGWNVAVKSLVVKRGREATEIYRHRKGSKGAGQVMVTKQSAIHTYLLTPLFQYLKKEQLRLWKGTPDLLIWVAYLFAM